MQTHKDDHGGRIRLGRRTLLTGAGAAAIASSVGAFGASQPAHARGPRRDASPAPGPIPGGVDSGLPPDHAFAFIHWFLPGPTDAVTPFLGLPGFGLDVEPSLITDYEGFTAYSVLSGQAKGSDGETYNVEFDVRVMHGTYRAEDGSTQHGTFGFF